MTIRPITAINSSFRNSTAWFKKKMDDYEILSRSIDVLIICCALNCIRNCNRLFSKAADSTLNRTVRALQATLSGSMVFVLWVWKPIFFKYESVSSLSKQLDGFVQKHKDDINQAKGDLIGKFDVLNNVKTHRLAIESVFTKMQESLNVLTQFNKSFDEAIQKATRMVGFQSFSSLIFSFRRKGSKNKVMKRGLEICMNGDTKAEERVTSGMRKGDVLEFWRSKFDIEALRREVENCNRFIEGDVDTEMEVAFGTVAQVTGSQP